MAMQPLLLKAEGRLTGPFHAAPSEVALQASQAGLVHCRSVAEVSALVGVCWALGTQAARRATRGRRRAGPVLRRAVDQAVDIPVTVFTTLGACAQETPRQRKADQYRLVLLTELSMSFTDTDGDHILLQKDGVAINEYVNGTLDVRAMAYFMIDKKSRAYRVPGGHGDFRPEDDVDTLVRKRDMLFVQRDFLARCLMTVCALKEADSFQIMMAAHTNGLAVVGTYGFETAEAYCHGLRSKGLCAEVIPVDNDA